jgi:Ser/Thr protein kinase RdoA (MazF antagonist)
MVAGEGPMTRASAVLEDGWAFGGEISPLGAGHINDTYLVVSDDVRWVLQRINSEVFVDPRRLMDNLERVVAHIGRRAVNFVPTLIPTKGGASFHVDVDGGFWRMSGFVDNTYTLQELASVDQAQAAGRAFARYQNLLADLPEPRLHEPIAGFLRLDRYLAEFESVAPRENRWRPFIAKRARLQDQLQTPGDYIHGDCKVNNLLFVQGGNEVRCVVDLDTTMRGHWAWDFGDLVRSGAARGDEFSVQLFAALVKGFVSEKIAGVDPAELVVAPRYICLMLGVRFLTDHLQGDRYFKVANRGENLVRAERQFRLLEAMEAAEREMQRLVRPYD